MSPKVTMVWRVCVCGCVCMCVRQKKRGHSRERGCTVTRKQNYSTNFSILIIAAQHHEQPRGATARLIEENYKEALSLPRIRSVHQSTLVFPQRPTCCNLTLGYDRVMTMCTSGPMKRFLIKSFSFSRIYCIIQRLTAIICLSGRELNW